MLIFIIVILGVLLFGILYSDLKIRFNFAKYGESNNISVSLTGLYGIFKYTKMVSDIDLIKINNRNHAFKSDDRTMVDKEKKLINRDKSIHDMNDLKELVDNYRNIYIKYKPYIKKIKEKLVFNNIYWDTKIGTDDAAETAIVVGAIWIMKTSIILLISKNYNFSNVLINVVPNYNINTFETTIDCIFSIKLGYIINADIKALIAQIKDGVKNE